MPYPQSRGHLQQWAHIWRQERCFCLATLRGLGRGLLALELRLQEEAAELVEVFHQEQGEEWPGQPPNPHSTQHTPVGRLNRVCVVCVCVCVCARARVEEWTLCRSRRGLMLHQ